MREIKVLKKKEFSKILGLLFIISLILNFGLAAEVITFNRTIKEYKDRAHVTENKIINNYDESQLFDECYSDKLKKLFDNEELMLLAQKQWGCQLTVNGASFGGMNMYLKDKNLKIVLAEFPVNDENILPKDILKKGTVSAGDENDSLEDNIQVISAHDFKRNIINDGDKTKIVYEFNDMPRGTMITIRLSEILKYKLNLSGKINNNVLRVIIS